MHNRARRSRIAQVSCNDLEKAKSILSWLELKSGDWEEEDFNRGMRLWKLHDTNIHAEYLETERTLSFYKDVRNYAIWLPTKEEEVGTATHKWYVS
jgi:hypothetical protein